MEIEIKMFMIVLVAAGFNYLPRLVGYLMAKRLPIEHPLFIWMEYVAYSIIAALSVRLIVLPTNALGEFSMDLRLGVCGMALLFYLKARKYLLLTLLLAMTLLVWLSSWSN